MTTRLTLRCCIAGAFLLQGCATQGARELQVHPALQVRHSSNETAEAYYQLGRTHQLQGNLELALSGYTYAIAREPRHMEARNAAAAIHAQQGRLDQARAMMLAVIADYPSASQAHNNLGYIDYLRGAHAGAAQEIRHALTLDPRNRRAQNNLRLVEAALAAAAPQPAPSAAPAPQQRLPEPAAAIAIAAVPAPLPQLSLIQVVPNVYELKMTPAPAAPPALAVTLPPPLPLAMLAAMPGARAARVEVANGEGTPGLARRVGAQLTERGFAVARLSNQRPYGQHGTRIDYRPGYALQAEALGRAIGAAVQLAPVQSIGAGADLRVVLGRDTQRALALRERAAAPRLAAR